MAVCRRLQTQVVTVITSTYVWFTQTKNGGPQQGRRFLLSILVAN